MSPTQFPVHVPLNAYSPDFLARLRGAGVNVQEKLPQQVAAIKGTAAVVAIDESSGVVRSAEIPGMFSFAVAAHVPTADPEVPQGLQNRPDWAHYFSDAGVAGTIVVSDERQNATWVYDRTRAQARYIPASTFKIPHTLFALDAGVVRDEFQIFPWDRVKREIESWNHDQNLRSAMRNSVAWVYQGFARELGETREREYLQRVQYGNADPSGGLDRFWLDGALRISAHEQIAFLQRLYRNELPFRIEHQRLVKDLMIVEAGSGWILRAKTGWAAGMNPQIGWWVGWVERPEGAIFFALNIDMPHGGADAPKRQAIARAILTAVRALPAS